jgi:hypothetical protein
LKLAPFTTICSESISETVYVNRKDNRILYFLDYGCGAWDSDPSSPKLTEKVKINKYLYFEKEYKEEELDLSVWKQESIKLHEWRNK